MKAVAFISAIVLILCPVILYVYYKYLSQNDSRAKKYLIRNLVAGIASIAWIILLARGGEVISDAENWVSSIDKETISKVTNWIFIALFIIATYLTLKFYSLLSPSTKE